MKKLFSETVGFPPAPGIEDEAPGWLREALIVRAISPILRVEKPHISMGRLRYMEQMSQRPIDCSTLIEHIALANQISPATFYRNSLGAMTALTGLLMSLSWGRFYDVLVLLAEELDGVERNSGLQHAKQFRSIVNNCFRVGHVNWFLSDDNTLERLRPVEFVQLEEQVRKDSDQQFVKHLDKAKGFLDQRPTDAANAIKESVSAIECYARTLCPKSLTLGVAIRTMKKTSNVPPLLLSAIEKLYAFASDEPGVRHGSPVGESVERADAELVYIASIALIKYLRTKEN
jgi:hypothetical protein